MAIHFTLYDSPKGPIFLKKPATSQADTFVIFTSGTKSVILLNRPRTSEVVLYLCGITSYIVSCLLQIVVFLQDFIFSNTG
jgi:hypothetical protein